jgi:hypothetical protein
MAGETSPDTAALEQQAIDCARRGDFGPAARALNEELTRLVPGNGGAWTRLARCCVESGLIEAAEPAIDAALRLNPSNTIARNLQVDIERQRRGPVAAAPRRRTPSRKAQPSTSGSSRGLAGGLVGLSAQDFTTLGHMPASGAADALEPRLEPLLMALNDRPFAQRVVEARNRAGQPANALYRRSTLQGGPDGHLSVFHYGGRWEPQMNIGLFAAPQWGRNAIRAGIGFNLADPGEGDPAGLERALDYYARFQRLVSSTWRQLLTAWMRSSGGFIQYGENRPATDMLPADAVSWLANLQNPAATGWIFCGSWLFSDAADHAAIIADGRQLVTWFERTFTDLLPLWTTVFRP